MRLHLTLPRERLSSQNVQFGDDETSVRFLDGRKGRSCCTSSGARRLFVWRRRRRSLERGRRTSVAAEAPAAQVGPLTTRAKCCFVFDVLWLGNQDEKTEWVRARAVIAMVLLMYSPSVYNQSCSWTAAAQYHAYVNKTANISGHHSQQQQADWASAGSSLSGYDLFRCAVVLAVTCGLISGNFILALAVNCKYSAGILQFQVGFFSSLIWYVTRIEPPASGYKKKGTAISRRQWPSFIFATIYHLVVGHIIVCWSGSVWRYIDSAMNIILFQTAVCIISFPPPLTNGSMKGSERMKKIYWSLFPSTNRETYDGDLAQNLFDVDQWLRFRLSWNGKKKRIKVFRQEKGPARADGPSRLLVWIYWTVRQ